MLGALSYFFCSFMPPFNIHVGEHFLTSAQNIYSQISLAFLPLRNPKEMWSPVAPAIGSCAMHIVVLLCSVVRKYTKNRILDAGVDQRLLSIPGVFFPLTLIRCYFFYCIGFVIGPRSESNLADNGLVPVMLIAVVLLG